MINPKHLLISVSKLDVVPDVHDREKVILKHKPTGKEVEGIYDYKNRGDGKEAFVKELMKELQRKITE
jgi:hypothetical protein